MDTQIELERELAGIQDAIAKAVDDSDMPELARLKERRAVLPAFIARAKLSEAREAAAAIEEQIDEARKLALSLAPAREEAEQKLRAAQAACTAAQAAHLNAARRMGLLQENLASATADIRAAEVTLHDNLQEV